MIRIFLSLVLLCITSQAKQFNGKGKTERVLFMSHDCTGSGYIKGAGLEDTIFTTPKAGKFYSKSAIDCATRSNHQVRSFYLDGVCVIHPTSLEDESACSFTENP